MELTLGIMGDFWTLRRAAGALGRDAVTSKMGEDLFEGVRNMTLSMSSLDRLPKLSADRTRGRQQARHVLGEETESIARAGHSLDASASKIAAKAAAPGSGTPRSDSAGT